MYNLSVNDYAFLDKFDLAALVMGGSHAYGLANENSDVDIRGVAFNSREELLLGKDFESYSDNNTDTVIYSHQKFLKLLQKCNMKALEMLGVRSEDTFKDSAFFNELLFNQDKYISKELISQVLGYVNAQMRLVDKKMDAVSDDHHNVYLTKSLQYSMRSLGENFDINFYIKDGKIYMKGNYDASLTEVMQMYANISNLLKQDKKENKSSSKKMPIDVMAKAQANVLYAYLFLIDILEGNGIKTYRSEEDRKLLLAVKNKEFVSQNKPTKEFYDLVKEKEERLTELKTKTHLREKADEEFFNSLLIKTNAEIVRKG